MVNTLYTVTCYKKNKALENQLQSLVDYKYHDIDVMISDDNCNKPDIDGLTVQSVCEKFKGKFNRLLIQYSEKSSQLGISTNKNRLIKYFTENHERYDHLILADDDIVVNHSGIIKHLEKIKNTYDLHHINGYWTDESAYETSKLVGLTGLSWSQDFPTIMENKDVFYSRGCQGCFVWVSKEMVLKAGYFRKFPYFYGNEHSEYSTRINALSGWANGIDNGEEPLFPMLKRSEKYFHGQFIANRYEVQHNIVEVGGKQMLEAKNTKKYREYLSDTRRGIGLHNPDHGLPKKGEVQINV